MDGFQRSSSAYDRYIFGVTEFSSNRHREYLLSHNCIYIVEHNTSRSLALLFPYPSDCIKDRCRYLYPCNTYSFSMGIFLKSTCPFSTKFDCPKPISDKSPMEFRNRNHQKLSSMESKFCHQPMTRLYRSGHL